MDYGLRATDCRLGIKYGLGIIGKPESGIRTGIGTGTGSRTGIGTGMERETYIKTLTTLTLI